MAIENEKKNDQILDLTALAIAHDDRPKVKFPDGKVYTLITITDIGIFESALLEQRSKRLVSVLAKKQRTEADAKILKDLIDELARLIVSDAPDADVDALSDYQKIAIIERFNSSLPETKGQGADNDAAPLSTTGN